MPRGSALWALSRPCRTWPAGGSQAHSPCNAVVKELGLQLGGPEGSGPAGLSGVIGLLALSPGPQGLWLRAQMLGEGDGAWRGQALGLALELVPRSWEQWALGTGRGRRTAGGWAQGSGRAEGPEPGSW